MKWSEQIEYQSLTGLLIGCRPLADASGYDYPGSSIYCQVFSALILEADFDFVGYLWFAEICIGLSISG